MEIWDMENRSRGRRGKWLIYKKMKKIIKYKIRGTDCKYCL